MMPLELTPSHPNEGEPMPQLHWPVLPGSSLGNLHNLGPAQLAVAVNKSVWLRRPSNSFDSIIFFFSSSVSASPLTS